MKNIILAAALSLAAIAPSTAHAQEAVVVSDNPDVLFTSPDPKLNANKQVVYKIILELLEAGHWDKASQYIADDYIQHNLHVVHVDDFKNGVAYTNIITPDGSASRRKGTLVEIK